MDSVREGKQKHIDFASFFSLKNIIRFHENHGSESIDEELCKRSWSMMYGGSRKRGLTAPLASRCRENELKEKEVLPIMFKRFLKRVSVGH